MPDRCPNKDRFSTISSIQKPNPHFFSRARLLLPLDERVMPAIPHNDIPHATARLERSHLASGSWYVPSQIGLGIAKVGSYSPPRSMTLASTPPIPCFPRWRISSSTVGSEVLVVGANRRWAWSNGILEGGRLSASKVSGYQRWTIHPMRSKEIAGPATEVERHPRSEGLSHRDSNTPPPRASTESESVLRGENGGLEFILPTLSRFCLGC